MLKLNRTTEYGIMALTYIRNKEPRGVSSAREIADFYHLPFEILAKTLQRLKELGIITSQYGTRGGYILAQELAKVNLADFIRFMEGPTGVVSCLHLESSKSYTNCQCEFFTDCGIKDSMSVLNQKMHNFMSGITMEELTSYKPSYIKAELVAACGEEP